MTDNCNLLKLTLEEKYGSINREITRRMKTSLHTIAGWKM
jgi:hypothetical protein